MLTECLCSLAHKLVEFLNLEYKKGPVFAHYMLNHELEVLFQEQVEVSATIVSPYLEAMLASDGLPEENAWTEYKLSLVCATLWNIYETTHALQKSAQSANLQRSVKVIACYWMKLQAVRL